MKKPSKKLTLILSIALASVVLLSCILLLVLCGRDKDNDNCDGNGNGNGNGDGGSSETIIYEKPIFVEWDGDFAIVKAARDANGRVISENVISLAYDYGIMSKYQYDNAGKITAVTYQYQEEGLYEEPYTEIFVLGDDGISYGNASSKIEYHANGKVKAMKLEDGGFGFDENGKRTAYFFDVKADEYLQFNYEGDVLKSYTYKESGKEDVLIPIVCNDDGYVTSVTRPGDYGYTVNYTYDAKGNITSESIVERYNGVEDYWFCTECEYDNKNNATKITSIEYSDANKTEIREKGVFLMQYNDKNLLTKKTVTYFDGEEVDYSDVYILEYNANGQVTKITDIYNEEATYVYLYEYNAQGLVLKYTEENYDADDVLEYKSIYEHVYDSMGRVITSTFKRYDADGQETYSSVNESEYNSKNQCIKNTSTRYENGEFEGKEVYEYVHGDDKLTVTITHYDEDGNITNSYTNEW